MLCGLIKHVLTSQSRCSRVLVCRLLIGSHHSCSQRIETYTQFLETEIDPGTVILMMEVIGGPNLKKSIHATMGRYIYYMASHKIARDTTRITSTYKGLLGKFKLKILLIVNTSTSIAILSWAIQAQLHFKNKSFQKPL